MERKRFLKLAGSILLVLVLVALAFGGCAKPVEEAKPINIGFTTDFTGVAASFGVQEAPVVEMMVEEANAAGGIDGRLIKLFTADNAGDPAKLVGHLKMFKERDKCVAMITGVTSTCNLAAKAWADENHIPIISPDPMSDKLIQKEGKAWWFRTMLTSSISVEVTLLRAKELGYTKIGFEGTALAWGTDVLATLEGLAPEYGVELVGSVLCEPKSKDLTIQAKKLQDTGAEAVIMAEYEAETGVWARALKDIGWNPYIIDTAGSCLAVCLGMYPTELFEDWETIQLIDDTKPLCLEVWDKYEAYTGKRYEDEKGPRTYDAIQLLLEAIRLSGNPDDPEAIRDGFYKIKNFPIATGRKETVGSFEIGRNHLVAPEDIPVYVVKSGKYVIAE